MWCGGRLARRLAYDVRHTALPSPGGEEELENLIGRSMSQALDPDQPPVGGVGRRRPVRRPVGTP
ncbi:MAG: wax ester/triacylglycerol synthase domain-containing protein [Ilumatobacteraceae bacterium]